MGQVAGRMRLAALVLLVAMTGCTAMQEIAAPWRDRPAESALYMVKESLMEVRVTVFFPMCDVEAPVGKDAELCQRWKGTIDPAVSLAYRDAVAGVQIAQSDAEANAKAALAVGKLVDTLDQLTVLDQHATRQDVYGRLAIVARAVLVGLQGGGES